LDEYGAKETEKILKSYYGGWNEGWSNVAVPVVPHFSFATDPKITSSYEQFHNTMNYFYHQIDPVINSDNTFIHEDAWLSLLDEFKDCSDPYLRLTFQAMLVKQAHNRKNGLAVVDGLKAMADSQWKVACLRFLSKSYGHLPQFKSVYSHLHKDIKDYIERKGE
jgi:hypothetical protein